MEATKIAESLPNLQELAQQSLCENCSKRLRYRDHNGLRKWCETCIRRYRQKDQRLQSDNIEQIVENIVHELFLPARLEHLSTGIQAAFGRLTEGKGLMLWGKAGRGKTYALAAMARYYLTEGYTVKWENYDLLCCRIRSSYQQNAAETELQIVKAYIEPDILFLDDVGTTVSPGKQESDFSLRTLLNILDQRLIRYKATFITSNKPVEQLATSFDERVASRIQTICVIIQCTGKDRRIENPEKQRKEKSGENDKL